MLNFLPAVRVFIALAPVDLRGSFNRLYGLVVDHLKSDPLSGNLYLFTNRRRNRIKIMNGDRVTLELSPYDLTRGRITYRHK